MRVKEFGNIDSRSQCPKWRPSKMAMKTIKLTPIWHRWKSKSWYSPRWIMRLEKTYPSWMIKKYDPLKDIQSEEMLEFDNCQENIGNEESSSESTPSQNIVTALNELQKLISTQNQLLTSLTQELWKTPWSLMSSSLACETMREGRDIQTRTLGYKSWVSCTNTKASPKNLTVRPNIER